MRDEDAERTISPFDLMGYKVSAACGCLEQCGRYFLEERTKHMCWRLSALTHASDVTQCIEAEDFRAEWTIISYVLQQGYADPGFNI